MTDSIALVEQIIGRISGSKLRKGTNSGEALSRNLMIAGQRSPRIAANSLNRFLAAASVGAV